MGDGEIRRWIMEKDTTGDGTVNLEEFLHSYHHLAAPSVPESISGDGMTGVSDDDVSSNDDDDDEDRNRRGVQRQRRGRNSRRRLNDSTSDSDTTPPRRRRHRK